MNVAEPGWQTTEFWIALVIAFIGLLEVFNILKISDSQKQSLIGFLTMLVPIAVYIISRGIRKIGTTNTVPQGTKLVTAATADATPPK